MPNAPYVPPETTPRSADFTSESEEKMLDWRSDDVDAGFSADELPDGRLVVRRPPSTRSVSTIITRGPRTDWPSEPRYSGRDVSVLGGSGRSMSIRFFATPSNCTLTPFAY